MKVEELVVVGLEFVKRIPVKERDSKLAIKGIKMIIKKI